MERLTARASNGMAYLIKVKPNEQEVDSPYPDTLNCILEAFNRLAEHEEQQNHDYVRIIRNYLRHMPKTYRTRTPNYKVVMDILMAGTSTGGMTSSIAKCRELGIDPHGHEIPD